MKKSVNAQKKTGETKHQPYQRTLGADMDVLSLMPDQIESNSIKIQLFKQVGRRFETINIFQSFIIFGTADDSYNINKQI